MAAYLSRGRRERIEESLRRTCCCWLGVSVPPPTRLLSSSELNRIQSSTSRTKCGVLSLKNSGDKKNFKASGEIGKACRSTTTAVIFAIGSMIPFVQLETLLGGNKAPMVAED